MALPRRAAPWWFVWCVAVVAAWALRCYASSAAWGAGGAGHAPDVQYAFWAFIITIASLIWKGLEVAGRITLEVLKWMVVNLSLIVTKIGNGLKVLGAGVLAGLKKAWEFFRLTYDTVLKPGWEKFWRWFDRFRRWLDDTFGPVLRFLRRVRDTLLDFWKRYIRPWLDLIDVTRRFLRVLNSLGLKWAGALDAELAAIEDAIERPFRLLLQKVNEIINLVDRVITANGLLQRVALIRSFARDFKFAWNVIKGAYDAPLTAAEKQALKDKNAPRTPGAIDQAAVTYIQTGEGPKAAVFEEMYLTVRSRVRAR